jgi:hypothetical protein
MEPVISNVERAILNQLSKPESELVKRVTEHNQILLHNYHAETPRECSCGLMGCDQTFQVTLIPNQALYPKFCESHRSEFRRRHFLERQKSAMQFVRIFNAPN